MGKRKGLQTEILLGLVMAGAAGFTQEARADCVTAGIRVWYSGDPSPSYVVGPDECVIPTPWQEAGGIGEDVIVDGVPSGAPNGVGFEVRFPLPV